MIRWWRRLNLLSLTPANCHIKKAQQKKMLESKPVYYKKIKIYIFAVTNIKISKQTGIFHNRIRTKYYFKMNCSHHIAGWVQTEVPCFAHNVWTATANHSEVCSRSNTCLAKGRLGQWETEWSRGQRCPLPFLCPLQMNIIHLIIYYHVIGRKFNKLLRAPENQYLLNAVYVWLTVNILTNYLI